MGELVGHKVRSNSSEQGKTIVVFGPTGTAGKGAIRACLSHEGVSGVRALTRRPLGVTWEVEGIRLHGLRRSEFTRRDYPGRGCLPVVPGDHRAQGSGRRPLTGNPSAVCPRGCPNHAGTECARHVHQPVGFKRQLDEEWSLLPLIRLIPGLGIESVDLGLAMLVLSMSPKNYEYGQILGRRALRKLLADEGRSASGLL